MQLGAVGWGGGGGTRQKARGRGLSLVPMGGMAPSTPLQRSPQSPTLVSQQIRLFFFFGFLLALDTHLSGCTRLSPVTASTRGHRARLVVFCLESQVCWDLSSSGPEDFGSHFFQPSEVLSWTSVWLKYIEAQIVSYLTGRAEFVSTLI